MLLMAVPALPLPTGGATHVLEVITVLVAFQLVAGRRRIWVPERWSGLELAGPARQRIIRALLKLIRFFERFSRPRLRWLLDPRVGRTVFGLLVIALSVAAFVAPPFSGLDTLPSLGVVILSLGILLEDFVVAVVGIAVLQDTGTETLGAALAKLAGPDHRGAKIVQYMLEPAPFELPYGPYAFLLALGLLVAVFWAFYQSRARPMPLEPSAPDPWRPAYPGVEHPPPASGAVVRSRLPGWLPSLAMMGALAGFVALAYK